MAPLLHRAAIIIKSARFYRRGYQLSSCVCLSVASRCCIETAKCIGSRKQRQTIAMQFSDAESLGKTQTGSPTTEAPNAGGVCQMQVRQVQIGDFRPEALSTLLGRKFITLSVHLTCLQHVRPLSATADLCCYFPILVSCNRLRLSCCAQAYMFLRYSAMYLTNRVCKAREISRQSFVMQAYLICKYSRPIPHYVAFQPHLHLTQIFIALELLTILLKSLFSANAVRC